jgi:hypothetical protein
MNVTVSIDIEAARKLLGPLARQADYAAMLAVNRTATQAREDVQREMQSAFDRPTSWVINSLRIKYAKKSEPIAEVAFKDRNSVESSRTMIAPHVDGGTRAEKGMEFRLRKAGILPPGWFAMPGKAADIDANGNMSRGQITQLLNVLGTYREAGYNKADDRTVARLKRGTKKAYGFEYVVFPVGGRRTKHLQPGVWKKVITPFGIAIKPILIFVTRANYRKRLDFYGIVQRRIDESLSANWNEALRHAVATAREGA